ncbi:Thioredoxin [uncultured archaeon]|nr:Thioredoxin [uncultured archaeon]
MAEKSVMDLDDASWEAVVEKGDKPVVVMFYDQLCPHCMIMMPHFEKYAENFKDKILFARIDVTRNPLAVSRYGIMATPTFKFFCGGRPVQEIVGEIYPTLLKKITEEALEYSKDCGSRSTPIDYNIGYA